MKTKASAKKGLAGAALLDDCIKSAQRTLYADRVKSAAKIVDALKPVLKIHRTSEADKQLGFAVKHRCQQLIKSKTITANRVARNDFVPLVKLFFPKEQKYIQNRYAAFLHFAQSEEWPVTKLGHELQSELKRRSAKSGKSVTFDDICREGSKLANEAPD